MKNFAQKIKNFVVEKQDYLIISAIIFVLFSVFLMINEIYPFGENTILISDSYHQLGSFFNHIFAWLKGEADLFYTNNVAGGTEIFSTIEYMFLNPFYLVVLFFGQANVLKSVAISVFGMILFNGLVFLWFAKKYFKKLSQFKVILFTLIFTFGMFINFNMAFITWLIFPGITLLLIDAFLRLIAEHKIARFTVTLVWFVINCFSVGFSVNILLVFIFLLYIFIITPKDERKLHLTKLATAYLIAIFACVIILFPSIIALTQTQRVGSFSLESYSTYPSKLCSIFFDFSLIFFAIIYFIFCNKKSKKNKFFMLTFLLLLAQIVFDIITRIISGVSYVGFPNRFGFLFEIILIFIAMTFFEEKPYKPVDCKSKKKVSITMSVSVAITFALILMYVLLNLVAFGQQMKNPVNKDSVNLKIYFCMFILVSLVLGLIIFFNKQQILSKRFLKNSFTFSLVVMLSINFLAFCGGNQDKKVNNTRIELVSGFVLNDGKLNQVGNQNFYASGIHFYGFFSSLINNKTLTSYNNIIKVPSDTSINSETNLLQDSILGIKYLISERELDRPYLKLLNQIDGVYLYENTLISSGAYVFDEDYEYDEEKTFNENMTALAESLGLNLNFFDDNFEIVIEDMNLSNSTYGISKTYHITVTANTSGILYGYYGCDNLLTNEKINEIKSSIFGEDFDGDLFYVNTSLSSSLLIDIQYLEAGETYDFYMVFTNDAGDFEPEDLTFEFLNYESIKAFCEALKEVSCEFTFTKSGYEVIIPEGLSGKLYVFTPDISGMSYTLNGEEVSISHECGYMVVLSVDGSGGTLVAKYSYPYGKVWLIVSVVMLALICLMITLFKTKLIFKAGKVIAVLMEILFAILLIVFAVGIVLSIISFF